MSKGSVEDLVKAALKEALEKKAAAKAEAAPSDLVSTLVSDAVKTVVVETKPTLVLGEHQKAFGDVIGNINPKDDFAVSCFFHYEWDDKIASFIPEVNEHYSFDEELASAVLRAWELNEKVLCYGPTGAGKSSLIQELCARTGRPFIRVNCTGDMDSSMIFGQLVAKDGSTLWLDGPATEAVRYGAVFAWDEWDVTPPEISMGLQWLLEDNGKLFLKDMPGTSDEKMIVPHELFRLVAIGNTQGQGDDTGSHAGTNVQNTATLDRFGTAVFVNYMKAKEEEQMLKAVYPVKNNPFKGYDKLVKLANLVRQGYTSNQLSLTFSPRTLFNIVKKTTAGYTIEVAYRLVYMNKLNDTQKKVASELFNKVFAFNP